MNPGSEAGPFTDDMRALLRAWAVAERAEVEFRAHVIHVTARRLGRREVANAAASLVAAYRLTAGTHGKAVALEQLCMRTGFKSPGSDDAL